MKAIQLFAVLLLIGVLSNAQASGVKITGMYSDLQYNEEGGDLLGMELFIFKSRDGYQVLVQYSEGELPAASLVPLEVDGPNIRFTLPGDTSSDVGRSFSGIVSATGLKGHWADGSLSPITGTKDEILKRGKSYWE